MWEREGGEGENWQEVLKICDKLESVLFIGGCILQLVISLL